MNRLDCAQLVDLAPELAVGTLCGEERAAAIAHLATCPSCQQEVNSLTTVTDRLLLLAPRAEPSDGFEQRVLAAIPTGLDRRRPPRRRVWALLAAAAAALTLALSAGALLLGGSSEQPAFAAATMRTSAGDVVGQVIVDPGDPASLFLTLPGWAEQVARYGAPGAAYAVRIETADGGVTTRPITPADGASWATTLDVDRGDVRSVAVVDGNGYVWCEAELATS